MTYNNTNHIRCPHCNAVVRHPELEHIGKRPLQFTCPQCGNLIKLSKNASTSHPPRVSINWR